MNQSELLMNEKIAQRRWSIIEEYIPSGAIGAELGVFKGHLSSYFLKKNPKKIYLVDPWYRLGPNWKWVTNQDSSTLNAFRNLLDRFEKEINAGVLVPIVEFSQPFLTNLEPKSLDFIYLDSTHTYKDTISELSAASVVLKDNGVLLGDDWYENPNHRHHGVTKAVKEFIENGKCELLFEPKLRQWGVHFLENAHKMND